MPAAVVVPGVVEGGGVVGDSGGDGWAGEVLSYCLVWGGGGRGGCGA